MNKNLNLVFVYGTLVRGGRLHHNLLGAKYMGDYILNGYGMYKVGPWYPGIIPESGQTTLGEVYEADDECLAVLDGIEGAIYDRIIVSVTDPSGGQGLECMTYVFNRAVDPDTKIKENIWPDKKVRVFGYGSLMNSKDFYRMYTKEEKKIISEKGNGILRKFRLGYTYWSSTRNGGVLDVVAGSGDDHVIGVVYEMPYHLMTREIDKREGNGRLYKRDLVKIDLEDKSIFTYCYFILPHRKSAEDIAPADEYNKIVLDGMREHNFPSEYINRYLEYVKSLKK